MTNTAPLVARWIGAHARPPTDIDALRALVGDAVVVGLGVPTHGAHELSTLGDAVLRSLVDDLGFRALVMEESPAAGARLDHHLRTGEGDPRTAVGGLWPHHRTEELLATVGWMRARNERHPDDPVRFVGVDPSADEPMTGDRIAWAEPRLAEGTLRWHEETGDKVVYWGGGTHTAVGEARTVTIQGSPPATHRNAGHHLRDRLGPGYVSVGFTFHHGSVDPGPGVVVVPAAAAGFAEATLDAAGPGPYLLDLRHARAAAPEAPAATGGTDAPEPVRAWLEAPARLRLVGPWYDPAHPAGYHMTGGSLAGWFDAVVHVRQVTPVRSLG